MSTRTYTFEQVMTTLDKGHDLFYALTDLASQNRDQHTVWTEIDNEIGRLQNALNAVVRHRQWDHLIYIAPKALSKKVRKARKANRRARKLLATFPRTTLTLEATG
jgi:hypothetical protein